jgi:hypothetical protein
VPVVVRSRSRSTRKIVLTFALSAVNAEQPASRQAQAAVAKPAVEVSAKSDSDDAQLLAKRTAQPAVSVLHQLLIVFNSDGGRGWQAYDGVMDVTWRDAFPLFCTDVLPPNCSHARVGTMRLLGYDETELPDLDPENETGLRFGNEGESSLSLNGDSGEVHEIAIIKYYPEEDVGGVLRRQLPDTVDVTLIGSNESAVEAAGSWWYRIRMPDGGEVYADIFTEEGGRSGPGFTTFIFSRNDPRKRTPDMRCREE